VAGRCLRTFWRTGNLKINTNERGTDMLEIQKSVLTKAIKLLNSIKVEYAILADGEKYGTLEVAGKKRTVGKRAFAFKYGRNAVLNYVKPYIDNLEVGEIIQIPLGEYDLDAIAATSASHAHKVFGTGGHTSRKDKKNNTFSIMRLEV